MALVNRYILVGYYDVGGPRLWHERLALEWISDENYVIATPDRDVYVEQLSLLNGDFRGIRVRAGQGVLPAGVNAAEVYPLPAWDAADLAMIALVLLPLWCREVRFPHHM